MSFYGIARLRPVYDFNSRLDAVIPGSEEYWAIFEEWAEVLVWKMQEGIEQMGTLRE